jgi:hypothetical protein
MTRCARLILLPVMVWGFSVVEADAQRRPTSYGGMSVSQSETNHSVTVNPIGWMFDFYNIEYEGKLKDGVTAGAGGSMRTWPTGTRWNGDVFVRYYLTGREFTGLSLGAKVGPTRQSTGSTYLGVGFDVNQTVPITDHIVVSSGVGVKRLIGADANPQWLSDDRRVVTARLNLGIRF